MDFKLPHPDAGYELGNSERKVYFERIEALRKLEDEKAFECLSDIYTAVEASRAPEGREVEWAVDMIRVYRNLGYITSACLDKYGAIEKEGKLQGLLEIIRKL